MKDRGGIKHEETRREGGSEGRKKSSKEGYEKGSKTKIMRGR